MKLNLDYTNLFWWYSVITLAFIIAAVAGWTPGYLIVIAIRRAPAGYLPGSREEFAGFSCPGADCLLGVNVDGIVGGWAFLHLLAPSPWVLSWVS